MINYVIACWSGLRRINPKVYIKDRSIFIKKHLKTLFSLKHSIDQVTIVITHNPDEPKEFREYISSLPSVIGSTKIVIIERPNIGYSYGGYSEVFDKYKEEFEYYMLMEDDYTFMLDNFDKIMINEMQDEKCAFATFWVRLGYKKLILRRIERKLDNDKTLIQSVNKYYPDEYYFPIVSVGMVKSKAMSDVCKKYGHMPFSKSNKHQNNKIEGQFALSTVFQQVGWHITDVNTKYRVSCFSHEGAVAHKGPKEHPIILAPIQALI